MTRKQIFLTALIFAAALALALTCSPASAQPTDILFESDIQTARPRVIADADSLAVYTARIEPGGGSVDEFTALYDDFSATSADFFDNSGDPDWVQHFASDLFGPLMSGAAIYWATKNSSEYTAEHAATYTKLRGWADDIVASATSLGYEMLSVTDHDDTNPTGVFGVTDDWGEGGRSRALWAFVDALVDTLAEGDSADQQLREDLLEIAVAWWDAEWDRFGPGGPYVTSGGVAAVHIHGYPFHRHMSGLVTLFVLLAHIDDPWSGTLTLWDGTTYSNTLYTDRLGEWWPLAVDLIGWDHQRKGSNTTGYTYRHRQTEAYWHPVHWAVPTQSPLTVRAPGSAANVPWWVAGVSGRNWHGYYNLGEIGGPAGILLDGGPIYDYWVAIGRAYASALDDGEALDELDKYVATEGIGDDWRWMEMLHVDSLRTRVSTRSQISRHYGDVSDAPLGPTFPGRWSTLRSDRTDGGGGYDPFERSETSNGTIVAHVYVGGPDIEGAGHGKPGAGDIELWYDGVLMTCRGGISSGTRAWAWAGRHATRLRNLLQIDDLNESDDANGFPYPSVPASGGRRAEDYDDLFDDVRKYSWVSRFKSLANGAYERIETEAAYFNDLIPEHSWAQSAQDSAFRELTLWGPYLVVREGAVPAQANVRISTNWRKTDVDGLWTWDGTQTGGDAPNAFGGTPDASSTNSTYVEYVKEGTGGTPYRMRVSVPWVSTDWAVTLSQGPASNGVRWAGEWQPGQFDNGGDLGYEFQILGNGEDQRRTSDGVSDPSFPDRWTEAAGDSLDYGGYVTSGTARVTMGGTGTDDGVHMIALQVIEIGPDGETFATVEEAESVPDSLVGVNILDADTTLVHVSPWYIGKRTAGGLLTIGADITAAGARVIWTGLQEGSYSYIHDADTLGVLEADSSGVLSFVIPDSSDNVVELYFDGTFTPPNDLNPPNDPENVAATALDEDRIQVTWDTPTDPDGAISLPIDVLVRRDGTLVTTTQFSSFTDSDLEPETTYGYTVQFRDQAENLSAESSEVTATTDEIPPGDVVGPPPPTGLQVNQIGVALLDIRWYAASDSSTGDSGVLDYTLLRTTGPGTSEAPLTVFSGINTLACDSVTAGLTYGYRVSARDSVPNEGNLSNEVLITIDAGGSPNNAPPPPSFVVQDLPTETAIDFSITESIDPDGDTVTYDVLEITGQSGGSSFLNSSTRQFSDDGLSLNVTYSYTTRACDEHDLCSAYDDTLSLTTDDETAPESAPSLSAIALTQFAPDGTTAVRLDYTIASDDSPPVRCIIFEVSGNPGGSNVSTTESFFIDSGLSVGTQYRYVALFRDSNGNNTALGDTVSVTTLAQFPAVSTGASAGKGARPLVIF